MGFGKGGYQSPPPVDTSSYEKAFRDTQNQLDLYQQKLNNFSMPETDSFVPAELPKEDEIAPIDWESKINELNSKAASDYALEQDKKKGRASTIKTGTLLDDKEVPTGTSLLTGKE